MIPRKRMQTYSNAQINMFDRPDAPLSPKVEWELGYDPNEETALEAFERENPIAVRGQTDQPQPLTAIEMEQPQPPTQTPSEPIKQYRQDNAGTVLAKIFGNFPLGILGFDLDSAINNRRERKFDEANNIGQQIGQAQASGDEGAMEDWRKKLASSGFADTNRGKRYNMTLAEALENYDTQRDIDFAGKQKQAQDKINTMPIGEWLSGSGVKTKTGREYIEKLWQIQQAQNKQAADIAKTQADTAKVQAEADNYADEVEIKRVKNVVDYLKDRTYFADGKLPKNAKIDGNTATIGDAVFYLQELYDGNTKKRFWVRDTQADALRRARTEADGRVRAANAGKGKEPENNLAAGIQPYTKMIESAKALLISAQDKLSKFNNAKNLSDKAIVMGFDVAKEDVEKIGRELQSDVDFYANEYERHVKRLENFMESPNFQKMVYSKRAIIE